MTVQRRTRTPRSVLVLLALLLALLMTACGAEAADPPTSVALPVAQPTDTPPALDTSTALPPPRATPAPTDSAVPTPVVPPTATPLPTATPRAALGDLEVHVVDVGQGDAILLLYEGRVGLIDGGDAGSGIVSYLQARGVESLDWVLATHPQADHIGGLVEVIQLFPVAQVITNGQEHTTRTYERFLDAIIASGAEYTEVLRGDPVALGSLALHVLYPVSPRGHDLNDQSIVLHLVHGQVAFLFTGDAEAEAEASIVNSGLPFAADILNVGHHGSRSSSTPAFLARVKPQVAIYSCARGNSYGHPHAETLANLANAGAQVYGTDANGTVVVISDGSTYRVALGCQGGPRAPPTQIPVSPAVIATPAATVASPDPATYTVEAGDSLSRIAARFGVSVTALAAINNISNPNMIRVGQVLIVPLTGYVPPTLLPARASPPVPPGASPPVDPPATLTPAPVAGPLAIELVSLTSPIYPGGSASLSIRTAPGAARAITVYYKSGASQAEGLGPQNAGPDGMATWRWKVGSRTTPGVWRIVVTTTDAGQRTSRDIPFGVR